VLSKSGVRACVRACVRASPLTCGRPTRPRPSLDSWHSPKPLSCSGCRPPYYQSTSHPRDCAGSEHRTRPGPSSPAASHRPCRQRTSLLPPSAAEECPRSPSYSYTLQPWAMELHSRPWPWPWPWQWQWAAALPRRRPSTFPFPWRGTRGCCCSHPALSTNGG
jgi:hypothetical protein